MNMPKTIEQEGLFDDLKKVVTTIGPIVLKTAPSAISAVAPIVKDLLRQGPRGNDEAQFDFEICTLTDVDVAEWKRLYNKRQYVTFAHWMHGLTGPNGVQVVANSIQNGIDNPKLFGQDTLLFVMTQYQSEISAVPNGPGDIFQLRDYIKIFGDLHTYLLLSLQAISSQMLHFDLDTVVGESYYCAVQAGSSREFGFEKCQAPGSQTSSTPDQNGTITSQDADVASAIYNGLRNSQGE
ncbi:hypothetical protein F5B21DRAFT_506556 [Xylaria acuta]|nr:hypothetical protein F5B21DRAFT_506556 [Xylaria acuta]